MARRRWLEFGVFDQKPPKWTRRLGPSGLAICLFRRLCMKTQPKCGLGPAGLAFGALQMHQAPIFRSFDVRLAVSDMLRLTPTTLSVSEQVNDLYSCTVGENQGAFAFDWVVEAD